LKEQVRLQGGKLFIFFGEGKKLVPRGIEKIPGVYQNYILSFFAQVFQEESPPGQTAKLAPSSTAGLVLPINVRAEKQGDDLLRLHLGLLPPSGEGGQPKKAKQKIFFHQLLRKMGLMKFLF
jgi:hypothetical protein